MLVLETIKVNEATSIKEIKEVLEDLLYVPDERVKVKVIEEYCIYLDSKSKNSNYEIKSFIARVNEIPVGIATCYIHPSYTSYGRKCGVIGWLYVSNIDICKELIARCESFFIKQGINKVRSGINFPKSLGGIGFQVKGFNEQMLYGVAFSSPEQNELKFLIELGYQVECNYTCLRVSSKTWDKGKKINGNIKFKYVPLKEIIAIHEQVQELSNNSFQGILPDTSGGRFEEFIYAFKQMPENKSTLNHDIKLKELSNNPAFLNAWESCDLEYITPLMPMAFEKKTNELIGVLLGLPDLYEHWNGKKITRVNVDTAIVRKDYKGKGIFSALNNIGQLTCSLYGMTYFEGTTVWTGNSRGVNNTDAINSIMPHCIPIRKHVVLQKRLRRKLG